MSRACTKETDGVLDPLPDLPMSSLPNCVIPPEDSVWQMHLRPAIAKDPANQPLITVDVRLLATAIDQYDRGDRWQIVDKTAGDTSRRRLVPLAPFGEALNRARAGDDFQ